MHEGFPIFPSSSLAAIGIVNGQEEQFMLQVYFSILSSGFLKPIMILLPVSDHVLGVFWVQIYNHVEVACCQVFNLKDSNLAFVISC